MFKVHLALTGNEITKEVFQNISCLRFINELKSMGRDGYYFKTFHV